MRYNRQGKEDLKSAVLDALAHDVKTPLTSIKASVSALLAESAVCARDRELLCVINEETEKLERIVNESIDLAQLELLELRPEKRCYDVKQTVEAALCDLQAPGRLQTDIPEDLPPVAIDFRLIKVVLRQLVDNALKYSPEDMPVTISARENDGEIIFQVKDFGEGIPVCHQAHVFNRQFRARKNGTSGTGLGLAIARRIVHAHGGRIGFRSSPGQGCMFHVSLPVSNGKQ